MLLYLANHRLPTEKAHGLQIVKMCEALADQGLEVFLISPVRKSLLKKDLFSYYNVERKFSFVTLPSPDFYFWGKLDWVSFHIKSFLSARLLAQYATKFKDAIIYSRDEWPLILSARFSHHLYYEAHKFSSLKKFLYRRLKKRGVKIIVITNSLKKEFLKLGFSEKDILMAPDGVDLEKFDLSISKEEARLKVGLPRSNKIALYSGSLYGWKGVNVFVDSKKFLAGVQLVVAGGNKSETRDGVLFIERQPHSEIPFFLKSADVLVLPNSGKQKLSSLYTSPLKMFEYMASRRPIVASDLPSIREVLNNDNSVLVPPDDPKLLANAIQSVLLNNQLAESISNQAYNDVKPYDWKLRAQKIIHFIKP